MSLEELDFFHVIFLGETKDTTFGTRHLPHTNSWSSSHVSQCFITRHYAKCLIQEL